ncbi:MAG: protein of unknown function UPF0118 [uncultured bacterium]|nr:MAG: protein of unknown function UPF0118 [uncultured bacterium]HBD04945.1 hypothetical protein [Candidatus Uhrbacteria bacterium]
MKAQQIEITTLTIFKVVLVFLALWFLWFIRDIVAILFVALLLAALIGPYADWFHKRKVPRTIAVLILYVILFALAAGTIVLIVPPLIEQIQQLTSNFSSLTSKVSEFFSRVYAFSAEKGFGGNILESAKSLQQGAQGAISQIFSTISGFFGGIVAFVLVLVLAFYMVVEEDSARRFFKHLAPEQYQVYLSALLQKIQDKIGAWMRGQLILMIAIGILSYVGLLILGVNYPLVLALFAGMLEIVPYIGPTFSVIPAAIIAFAQDPIKGVLVLGLYVLIQQIENNVLVPAVMKRVTGLNPVVAIVALLVGIKVAGFVGALLSVPVATVLMVVLQDFFSDNKSSESKNAV